MYIKKILLAIVIIGLIVAGYFAYFVYGAMFEPNTAFEADTAFVNVSRGSSYEDVREQLKPLLNDMETFDALAKHKKYTNKIKSGRFIIKRGMNNNDIINSIRVNNVPVKVTFNNQETIEKLAGRIATQIDADSLSLLEAMKDKAFLEDNGFKPETALGMYLPNSYELFWNSTGEQFRDRMLKEYKSFWNTSRKEKAKTLRLSESEVIALASIVYEESKQPSEQPRIAGVYLNRIRIGMPLQADPTIRFAAYRLPKYENTIIKRVLNVHKEIESPYNTYMNRGLPPGLIAMPDISAIDAVLNNEKHQYLYFVADAKRLGYHKFAKTLVQHNANARAYHAYLSSQGIYK